MKERALIAIDMNKCQLTCRDVYSEDKQSFLLNKLFVFILKDALTSIFIIIIMDHMIRGRLGVQSMDCI